MPPGILVQRSVSSACSTHGISVCSIILIFTACLLQADSLQTDPAGSPRNPLSFSPPECFLSRLPCSFVAGLKDSFRQADLGFHGQLVPSSQPPAFASWLRLLSRHDWVAYAKPPFGGPGHALRYLGNYTHRSLAISNHRLVALTPGRATSLERFRSRQQEATHDLASRRVPRPSVHYSPVRLRPTATSASLPTDNVPSSLPLCFSLLQARKSIRVASALFSRILPHSPWKCPVCGAIMHVLERLSAAQLLLRSPPLDGNA